VVVGYGGLPESSIREAVTCLALALASAATHTNAKDPESKVGRRNDEVATNMSFCTALIDLLVDSLKQC
jgi:hypothetical protein